MPLYALALLLIAAALHAGWNLLLKKADGNYAFVWWALILSGLVCLPVLLFFDPLPAQVWPYVIASALVEAAYYATLASAYQQEDFSLVYPIARGTAPALLTTWAVLFLHETPSPAGILGLVVLILGLIINGSSKWLSVKRRGTGSYAGIKTAGAVAIIISIYSAIDGAAVRQANPIPYSVWIFILTAVFITPVIFRQHGWKNILKEGRTRGLLAAATGVLSLLAYMLVLVVYSLAPVSYAGAIREVSIVLGALAGWLWLKEQFGMIRVAGSALIFIGILVIVIKG